MLPRFCIDPDRDVVRHRLAGAEEQARQPTLNPEVQLPGQEQVHVRWYSVPESDKTDLQVANVRV